VKRLLAACVVIAIVTARPAAASVFEEQLPRECEETLALKLDRGGEPAMVGVVGELLFGGGRYRAEVERERPFYSPVREGAASILLPGLGQLRMGRTLRAKIYFGLEGAAWVAIGSFVWQGYARENAYKDYAVAFAGISGTSYSDEYYETVGKYMSNDGPGGYNEYVRREARDLYYPDIEMMNSYFDQNSITGTDAWRWESTTAFRRYNHLRDGSRSSYRRALYAGFFALALRVISAVDAVRLARGSETGEKSDTGRISMGLSRHTGGFLVSITRSF
jgi:hypothetical protein